MCAASKPIARAAALFRATSYPQADEDARSILEPAGALGVAAIKQYVEEHKVKGRTHMSVWTNMLDGESEETSSWILAFANRVLGNRKN